MSSDQRYGDPKTRRRILDAALGVAADLGPAMRLADVSQAAGVSHQGLYLHFRGRDALLRAMLPHMVETFDLHARHQQIVEAPTGAIAARRMVEFLADLNMHLESIGWVLEEAQHLDEGFGTDWRRRVSGLRDSIESDVIRRLDSEEALRSVWSISDATDLFLALTTFGTWRELTRELGWSRSKYVKTTTRLIGKSLFAE